MSRNISELHPGLQAKLAELQTLCSDHGITIKIGECLRTVAEQDALYEKGRTAPGSIVTNAKGSSYSSQHQWGIAADFYLDMDIDGDGSKADDAFNNATNLFNKVGSLAKSIGLGWGGDWKNPVDKPHLYLPKWGNTTSKLKVQYGTPEAFMTTWGTTEVTVTQTATSNVSDTPTKEIVKVGQTHANNFAGTGLTVDGIRGTATKKAGIKVLQTGLNLTYSTGLVVDGVAGTKTETALKGKSLKKGDTNHLVTALEILLMLKGYNPGGVENPGVFGSGLDAAVWSYQRDNGLTVDGIAGVNTFKSLIG